jgi:Ulp1 family protease
MLDSDSEEEQQTTKQNYTRGLMNLITLTKRDIMTIEGKINDACINALSDVLHKQVKKERISICHTQFFVELKERGWQEACRYIQCDPSSPIKERWKANQYTQAHITSKVLIIPCHFPGHWALAIRVTLPTGKHVLHVLDSLGRDASNVTFGKVKEHLKGTRVPPSSRIK